MTYNYAYVHTCIVPIGYNYAEFYEHILLILMSLNGCIIKIQYKTCFVSVGIHDWPGGLSQFVYFLPQQLATFTSYSAHMFLEL